MDANPTRSAAAQCVTPPEEESSSKRSYLPAALSFLKGLTVRLVYPEDISPEFVGNFSFVCPGSSEEVSLTGLKALYAAWAIVHQEQHSCFDDCGVSLEKMRHIPPNSC